MWLVVLRPENPRAECGCPFLSGCLCAYKEIELPDCRPGRSRQKGSGVREKFRLETIFPQSLIAWAIDSIGNSPLSDNLSTITGRLRETSG